MIIFSSADMEASRGAIHKGMREQPHVAVKSRYEQGPIKKSVKRAGAQILETTRKYPLRAVAVGVLFGFVLGAFADVRRRRDV